jgi:hypothetical protein
MIYSKYAVASHSETVAETWKVARLWKACTGCPQVVSGANRKLKTIVELREVPEQYCVTEGAVVETVEVIEARLTTLLLVVLQKFTLSTEEDAQLNKNSIELKLPVK